MENDKKTLWTKAFADADGDENKQRALYIKMRAAELTGKAEVNVVTSNPTMGLSSEPIQGASINPKALIQYLAFSSFS